MLILFDFTNFKSIWKNSKYQITDNFNRFFETFHQFAFQSYYIFVLKFPFLKHFSESVKIIDNFKTI